MARASENTGRIEKNGDLTAGEKLNEFIQKNRNGLVAVIIILAVVLIGFIATITIREKLQSSALSRVEELNRRYEALRFYIANETPEAVEKQTDINVLLEDANAFAGKHSGLPAARAYTIAAGIYGDQKKWAEAGKAWNDAAKAAANTYLAPISIYNAAVAAEEEGNTEAAIGLYKQVLTYEKIFPAAARAQFAVGRLQESQNNKDAALEAYQNLVSKWPNDPVWSGLAQSRILILSN
jgi:tetratricopeptide (TPR) repeat protein